MTVGTVVTIGCAVGVSSKIITFSKQATPTISIHESESTHAMLLTANSRAETVASSIQSALKSNLATLVYPGMVQHIYSPRMTGTPAISFPPRPITSVARTLGFFPVGIAFLNSSSNNASNPKVDEITLSPIGL